MIESGRPYRTIKSLVLDHVHRAKGHVSYDVLTEEVRKTFPASRWKKTHWAWYRSQIRHGRFRNEFSDTERAALAGHDVALPAPTPPAPPQSAELGPMLRGPAAKDVEVKRIGDAILEQARFIISLAAGENVEKRFKLNRWVFSRLLQDEIRIKRPIKQKLWAGGMRSCQACGESFETLKGVEIHRKDESRAYSAANCELLCRECHQELG